jgi:3-hydroxy-D-aspartate aldolase
VDNKKIHTDIAGAGTRLIIGDKVRLIPGHCDPTVNLYD